MVTVVVIKVDIVAEQQQRGEIFDEVVVRLRRVCGVVWLCLPAGLGKQKCKFEWG